jgi:hypothetical protein
MTGRLNWEKANKREKSSPAPEQFQPVKTDAAFWRAWKDDPDAMRPPLTCPPAEKHRDAPVLASALPPGGVRGCPVIRSYEAIAPDVL